MAQEITSQWLQSVEALKEVPLEQLDWLLQHSTQPVLHEGDYLAEVGQSIEAMFIINKGRFRMYMVQQNQAREIAVFSPGDITGYLPFSRATTTTGTIIALEEAQILRFEKSLMPELIRQHFELTQALVHVMTTRVREFTALQQQNEKMMALGKLSAGLAHELNNPAAAIVRDSTTLLKHLQLEPQKFTEIAGIHIAPAEAELINEKLFAVLQSSVPAQLSLLERSAAEDDLNDWLDDNGLPGSCETAEIFVENQLNPNVLEDLKQHIPAQHLQAVIKWLTASMVGERLAKDIQESAKRISELVSSVKNFTHMDRGQDKQYADIHSGIRNTLTMLAHKFKKGNVKLIENFNTALPQVLTNVGELNQVWTNLIDNALDALENTPAATLEILTRRDHEFAQVCIIDNGPGIPEELHTRVFEPFFTTKEIGKGTGLGLDVVRRIVQQHRGSIKVTSQPGHTEFEVCFPING